MKRNDARDIFAPGEIEQIAKISGVTQFNIDIIGKRQKALEQFATSLQGEIIRTAFVRIARSDDDRCAQHRQFGFDCIDNAYEMVESQFEQVGRASHLNGEAKIGQRRDDADDEPGRLPVFDLSARRHIFGKSRN